MEKPKKERTEAQKKATLAMLKARREKKKEQNINEEKSSVSSDEDEKSIEKEVKPKKGRSKKPINSVSIDIPPTQQPIINVPKVVEPSYATKDDFHQFRNDILAAIQPQQQPVIEKAVIKKKVAKIPKKEVIVEEIEEEEEVVVKPKKMVVKQTGLTGYDLLDALLKR